MKKREIEVPEELAEFGSTPIFREEEPEGFLPEVTEEELRADEVQTEAEETAAEALVEGSELAAFESAEIEEERLDSILESILFATDRPVSLPSLKAVFKGTNVNHQRLKKALDRFAVELAGARRGVTLEEVPGGWQIRTKVDNLQFLSRTLKQRSFRLSGPALEVLAIVAYKQPLIKNEIDQIRGVESGHLLRALMEKNLVTFEGRSDLPGKPMQYGTTKKFMEIFGLRNLKELPTLSQIDELLPDGITEEEAEKPTLSSVTDAMSQQIAVGSYSQGEEELNKISSELETISTSSDFFEQEKLRQKAKREAERAQGIREAILVGETVSTRDKNWLAQYDEAQMAPVATPVVEPVAEAVLVESITAEEVVVESMSAESVSEESASTEVEVVESVNEHPAGASVADLKANKVQAEESVEEKAPSSASESSQPSAVSAAIANAMAAFKDV